MLYTVITIITSKTKKRKYWQCLSLGRGLVIKWRVTLCFIFVLLHYLNTLKFYTCISSIFKQKKIQSMWISYNKWMKTTSGWWFDMMLAYQSLQRKEREDGKNQFHLFYFKYEVSWTKRRWLFKETLQCWL